MRKLENRMWQSELTAIENGLKNEASSEKNWPIFKRN
jgi:hypothetical protein